MIGLGIMGGAMARHLRARGFVVAGYDPAASRSALARAAGVQVASGVREAAAGASAVVTSLPSEKALEESVSQLLTLERGAAPRPDILELSTLSLDFKQRMQARLASGGFTLLDCPISGTGAQAENRDLVVYASGDSTALARSRPVLEAFSKAVYDLGEFGNGTRLKLIANLLVAIHNVAAAEAIALAKRAGLDPLQACELLGAGAAASRMLALRGPMMATDSYQPATMKLDLWQKDLALIADFVRATGARAPLFLETVPLYDAAVRAGLGSFDTAAVMRVIESQASAQGDPV